MTTQIVNKGNAGRSKKVLATIGITAFSLAASSFLPFKKDKDSSSVPASVSAESSFNPLGLMKDEFDLMLMSYVIESLSEDSLSVASIEKINQYLEDISIKDPNSSKLKRTEFQMLTDLIDSYFKIISIDPNVNIEELKNFANKHNVPEVLEKLGEMTDEEYKKEHRERAVKSVQKEFLELNNLLSSVDVLSPSKRLVMQKIVSFMVSNFEEVDLDATMVLLEVKWFKNFEDSDVKKYLDYYNNRIDARINRRANNSENELDESLKRMLYPEYDYLKIREKIIRSSYSEMDKAANEYLDWAESRKSKL